MVLQNDTLTDSKRVYNISNSVQTNFSVFANGEIENINCGLVQVNLISGTPIAAGCLNLYLRKRGCDFKVVPLLGSVGCGKQFIDENNYQVKGSFEGTDFMCRLLLAENTNSWLWSVQLFNTTDKVQELDIIAVQDVGLSCADGNEKNDFYISQYIDYKSLMHEKYGHIVCCRQNEHGPNSFPWLALGSTGKVVNYSTDGVQFFGQQYRATAEPKGLINDELGGLLQREFGLVALQSAPMILEPAESIETGFFAIFHFDHPQATTETDLLSIASDLRQIEVLSDKPWSEPEVYEKPIAGLFSQSPLFVSDELTEDELNSCFGTERQNIEVQDGELLSFFCEDNRHVVLGRKELIVSKPHGHIMKTASSLVPDDATMSCSCYMSGVFISHLAQGNVNFNRFLTVNTNAFNVIRHTGQRIFIFQDGQYCQLALPSAFEMSANRCRWIYKQSELLFEIICHADADWASISLEINVLAGPKQEWLISNNLTVEHNWQIENCGKNNFSFTPAKQSNLAEMFKGGCFDVSFNSNGVISQIGGDELLFADGMSEELKFFVIGLEKTNKFEMRIDGKLVKQNDTPVELDSSKSQNSVRFDLSYVKEQRELSVISQILPWFIHNANIHYLTPHGLEQYGGAAWGTRDICQGPIEMLLAQGSYAAVRWILSAIFSHQDKDGNWPQWWMFDGYKNIKAKESHGDVIFWPILALSKYISASGDYNFLEEFLPFSNENVFTESESYTVMAHVVCAIENIRANRFSDGTALVNYSDGDWNDSMQPASSELKKKMVSSWTVGLSYQALKSFEQICQKSGRTEIAEQMQELCIKIRNDFNKLLVKDDVVAGFALIEEARPARFLLHPSDSITGIHYRLLPMIRGIISEIFTPAQAKLHAELIEKYLKGPDGARLMDCPARYNGGMQKYFRRAESSSYFGREVGIMYTHAHLRYAQAMAHLGYAEKFIKALLQVVPIDIQQIIPQADIRQSNCYYSSSDADFANRYQADADYEDLKAGKVKFNQGWRIYSSGPGMFVGFIISHLLGIRHSWASVIFDPVMTAKFDGLIVRTKLADKSVKLVYSVSEKNAGVRNIEINGRNCDFSREDNPYRIGGAVVKDTDLKAMLVETTNIIKVYL